MQRTPSARPERHPQPTRPEPAPHWPLLTEADRALAMIPDALTRTSRWQGNAT